MRSIALALGASLTWGFADFFGPLKGRTLGALRVLVYVQLGGLVVIGLIVAIRGKGPADLDALFAIPAAISGTLGLYAYYRGMAVGAMSIVAPIAGISAAVPVVFGIATGDRPSLWQWFGIAAALGGVFLASREPGRGGKVVAGVGLALLAAIGFGGYFPPMHAAGSADFWWASLIFRMTSASVILAAVAIRRPSLAVKPIQIPVLALIGPLRGGIDERPRQHYVRAGVALSDRHGRSCAPRPPRTSRPLAGGGNRVDARRRRAHFSRIVATLSSHLLGLTPTVPVPDVASSAGRETVRRRITRSVPKS